MCNNYYIMENLNNTLEVNLSIENKKRREYFKIAAGIAMQGQMRYRHGAILVKNGEIIAQGYNYDYGQDTYHGHYSVHAEVNVLLEARNKKITDLSDADLYVVRISPNTGNYLLSKPCDNCARMSIKHGVRRVYYSIGCGDETKENKGKINGRRRASQQRRRWRR